MSRKFKVMVVALLALAGVALHAFTTPDSALGTAYLRLVYDAEDAALSSVSAHIARTNGGYLPERFDAYLFSRLGDAATPSTERDNILRFYAAQAGNSGSRAGKRIFESGGLFAEDIARIGRSSSESSTKRDCLYLLEGLRRGKGLYKPGVWVTLDVGQSTLDELLAIYAVNRDPSAYWSEPS